MSDDDTASTSVRGVAFGPLKPALREHAYPVTRAELIEQYGGFELEHAEGSDLLESVLRETDTPRFHEPGQVRDAILDALDPAAVEDPNGDGETNDTGDWSRTSV
ncbi:MAG: hypothetical protein PPP55_03765 [Halorubrum sp.]